MTSICSDIEFRRVCENAAADSTSRSSAHYYLPDTFSRCCYTFIPGITLRLYFDFSVLRCSGLRKDYDVGPFQKDVSLLSPVK